jgi:pimeloyl-ACP methyl ester carboxylesterase
MCAAMARAMLLRTQLCAYLVSPAPQPTFIPSRRPWQTILPIRDLCWRSIIAVTASPNTIAIPTTTLFESHSPTYQQSWPPSRSLRLYLSARLLGVLAMMLAVMPPVAIAGVILNDIGPAMELRGLMRIKSYVGKLPIARNFEEGAEILRWLFKAQFTNLGPQDWVAFAQRTWREDHSTLVPSHDPKLARALRGFSLECLPTLWDQFDAMERIPLMVIRGANSDMLARPTLNEMLERRGQLEVVVVPDQGHAPLLTEPKVIRGVVTFVAACDAPA